MASDSLVLEMGQKLENMKKRAVAVRERAEKTTGRLMVGVAGAAGAAVCGVMQSELGEDNFFPGTEVEADLVVGGAIVALGSLGVFGEKYADEMVAFGSGIMSPAIARKTRAALKK